LGAFCRQRRRVFDAPPKFIDLIEIGGKLI
jgi:hypothetical protein